MSKSNIKQQIRNIYCVTGFSAFQLAGASWVVLLAARGYSLLEIGIMESIFHVVSLACEIPSGAVADVCGRKKTMIWSIIMNIVSSLCMIFSERFVTTAFAIGIGALSYNLSSGTREALAYDSLRNAGCEERYDKYAAKEMMIYRICSSSATLCAGLALTLGYKVGYTIDIIIAMIALVFAFGLYEVKATECEEREKFYVGFLRCLTESIRFIKGNAKARWIIVYNSAIGAVATLMLFFLQARLPQVGLPNVLLGPMLFFMGLGAAFGARMVSVVPSQKYGMYIIVSFSGIIIGFLSFVSNQPYLMGVGGFIAALSDDFLQVKSDIILNNIIPSEQRATLISVSSCAFSVVMIVLSTAMGWVFHV